MAQQNIRIRLKSYDHELIERSAQSIVETAQRSGATISGPVPLPTEKNVYCVIKSPFKDKDSREHFEIRTHKRLIDIHQPTPKTVDQLLRLEEIRRELLKQSARGGGKSVRRHRSEVDLSEIGEPALFRPLCELHEVAGVVFPAELVVQEHVRKHR